ncbi:uncharacterized protein LOC124267502 isoform X2 [Haliotis rubra]|uniref:uncharacterized protein LOC124267502 isoform X2 n=1 Tax=Haliotis rubra TaxID=36100 RepID=UPI001EE5ED26|nr:uncharacterized protein LOC124267502 isoform X2 [Haliotis rubra]
MSTRNPFELLQDEFEYLKSKLQLNGTKLIDHLFAKKVLTPAQMEEMNVISGNSKKIEKLVLLLTRRPAGDFDYFMEGLEEDQNHIKEHLQTCIMKKSANTGVEMEDDHEDMDGNTGEDRRINLKDVKTAEKTSNLAVSVTVVHRDKIEMRNGKEQFMAEVADKTSAVDICVTNRNLFDKIKVKSSLFLENVSWSGNVIFLNEKSKATSIAKIEVDPSLVEEAFGRGDVVSIQEALALKPKLWVALKGKIVKQSVITEKNAYERKLLRHRQIKLADRSGSMYVDVWEDEALNLKSGDVIHMTGCKRKKSESVDVSSVTTTRKTIVKKLEQQNSTSLSPVCKRAHLMKLRLKSTSLAPNQDVIILSLTTTTPVNRVDLLS